MSNRIEKVFHPEFGRDVYQPVIDGRAMWASFIEPYAKKAEAQAFIKGYERAQEDWQTAQSLERRLKEVEREFDIVDSACDFWKQEAINRGYKE
jgi:hypothetical protein